MKPLTIEKVKTHLKVSHSIEDDIISDYMEFARSDVTEAVFDSQDTRLNKEKLEIDPTFQRAVINLTSFYFLYRLTFQDEIVRESPFSVTHAIQTLRANKERFLDEET